MIGETATGNEEKTMEALEGSVCDRDSGRDLDEEELIEEPEDSLVAKCQQNGMEKTEEVTSHAPEAAGNQPGQDGKKPMANVNEKTLLSEEQALSVNKEQNDKTKKCVDMEPFASTKIKQTIRKENNAFQMPTSSRSIKLREPQVDVSKKNAIAGRIISGSRATSSSKINR